MKRLFLLLFLFVSVFCNAQEVAAAANIRTAQLYRRGDQTSFPITALGVTEALQLEFDDLDDDIKNYYYSFQLCNADWSPSILRPFEYLRGFQTVRINTYRNSSLSYTRYTHYQANLPDRNCVPIRSGNYLLRVFLNGDTSKIVFTKRMVIVDDRTKVGAVIQQPYSGQLFRTSQKLQIVINTDERVQNLNPTDLRVVVLQNYNWRTALFLDRPTIYRGNYYEYSDEAQMTMPAGKEFRWIDLRSFRLLSDRMERMNNTKDSTVVYISPILPVNRIPISTTEIIMAATQSRHWIALIPFGRPIMGGYILLLCRQAIKVMKEKTCTFLESSLIMHKIPKQKWSIMRTKVCMRKRCF